TASTIAFTVATAVGAVASATGAVASTVKAADDIDDAVSGKHFLTNDQRTALGTVQTVAGAVAAVSGLATIGATAAGAGEIAETATQDASNDVFYPDSRGPVYRPLDPEWDPDSPMYDPKRSALIEGENNDLTPPSRYALIEGEEDSVLNSQAAKPPRVTPEVSRPIPIQQTALKTVVGSNQMNASDSTILKIDKGLTASLRSNEAASDSEA